MDPYVNHIIKDIRRWSPDIASALDGYGKHGTPLSFRTLTAYEVVHLPVPEKLCDRNMRKLVRQFELFCNLHAISLHWPYHLEAAEKYALIIDNWNSKNIHFDKDGSATVQFCHGHLAICCFGSKDCICGAKFKPFPYSHLGPAA